MNLIKLSAILVAFALTTCAPLFSQGEQRVHITGTEEAIVILPWWTSFTTVQTLSIPSLQVDELVLTIVSSSPGGIINPGGDLIEFKGFGTGMIYDADGYHVGNLTFYYVGQSPGPLSAFEYVGETEIVGTFFAGPLEGLVLRQMNQMVGSVEFESSPAGPVPIYPYYFAEVNGYLSVPGYVDFQALKESFNTN